MLQTEKKYQQNNKGYQKNFNTFMFSSKLRARKVSNFSFANEDKSEELSLTWRGERGEKSENLSWRHWREKELEGEGGASGSEYVVLTYVYFLKNQKLNFPFLFFLLLLLFLLLYHHILLSCSFVCLLFCFALFWIQIKIQSLLRRQNNHSLSKCTTGFISCTVNFLKL